MKLLSRYKHVPFLKASAESSYSRVIGVMGSCSLWSVSFCPEAQAPRLGAPPNLFPPGWARRGLHFPSAHDSPRSGPSASPPLGDVETLGQRRPPQPRFKEPENEVGCGAVMGFW